MDPNHPRFQSAAPKASAAPATGSEMALKAGLVAFVRGERGPEELADRLLAWMRVNAKSLAHLNAALGMICGMADRAPAHPLELEPEARRVLVEVFTNGGGS